MSEPDSLQFVGSNEVLWQGRRLVYFSGCDYFRLARDARLARAALDSLRKNGLNVAASRRTTGNHAIYAQLEAALRDFFAAPAAVLLPDGYFAPLAATQALAGRFSIALIDALAHGAVRDAARMLGCPVRSFQHRDAADLAKRLAKAGRNARPIILTDGMFSHDGSVAPLRAYLRLLPSNGLILVDDAHGAGVLGATGKGSLELEEVPRQRIVQCVTLSKAFGAYGGAVLGSKALRARILEHAWTFIGTTPLPPPMAGAALAALKLLPRESQRREQLARNVRRLREGLRAAGWNIVDTPGPIVRLPPLRAKAAANFQSKLIQARVYPPFIQYGAQAGAGAFRFVVSSEHQPGQLARVIAALT